MKKKIIDYECPWELVVDTREQLPWSFEDITVGTGQEVKRIIIKKHVAKLNQGDYSISGMADRIAIERKSKQDWYSTIGRGRNRFIRELSRLNSLDFAAVIIESEFMDMVGNPPERSKVTSSAVVGNIIAFQQRFPRVHFWLLPGRYVASKVCWKILHRFWEDHQNGK